MTAIKYVFLSTLLLIGNVEADEPRFTYDYLYEFTLHEAFGVAYFDTASLFYAAQMDAASFEFIKRGMKSIHDAHERAEKYNVDTKTAYRQGIRAGISISQKVNEGIYYQLLMNHAPHLLDLLEQQQKHFKRAYELK